MNIARSNIVQMEFFSPNGKIIVRIYDDPRINLLTHFVERFAEIEEMLKISSLEFNSLKGIRRILGKLRLERLAQQVTKMESDRKLFAAEQLRRAAQNLEPVAVEDLDFSFRFARTDEIRCLVERAYGAINVWLFVFKPNDLLSSNNSSVLSCL